MTIESLLAVASGTSRPWAVPKDLASVADVAGRRALEALNRMLSAKNGFYAFEAALHVRSWQDVRGVLGIESWNQESLWRGWYQGAADGMLFFAEDIFGGQFGLMRDTVVTFDPESGETEKVADSVDEWASAILRGYREMVAYPVAHDWQEANGPIKEGQRLLPKLPFILGGDYETDNLFAVDDVKAMRYRGELWLQLRDLPDGAKVKLRPIPLQ